MPAEAVIGLQWGDEGKGGVVDLLAADYDVVVRYQGGANAGHTVVVDGVEHIFHLVPSGVLHPHVEGILASGMVVDPDALLAELDQLRGERINVEGRLWISDRAHLVLPFHKRFEELTEESLGDDRVGTTHRGIGPAYADKALRVGLRFGDLFEERALQRKIAASLRVKGLTDDTVFAPYGPDALVDHCRALADRFRPFVTDTVSRLLQHLDNSKAVLLEGAQGVMLDIDHGTYPFVTSSNCGATGASAGCGIPPTAIGGVIGIAKAYSTRVGNGPFPTEMSDDMGDRVRRIGNEYGATTRRPRRAGWFDGVAGAYAARINGVHKLVITKLDVLTGIPRLKLCTAYQANGERLHRPPASAEALARCEPVYEELEGWDQDLTAARSPGDLPSSAVRYLHRIAELVGAPLWMVSVGPQRDQYIRF